MVERMRGATDGLPCGLVLYGARCRRACELQKAPAFSLGLASTSVEICVLARQWSNSTRPNTVSILVVVTQVSKYYTVTVVIFRLHTQRQIEISQNHVACGNGGVCCSPFRANPRSWQASSDFNLQNPSVHPLLPAAAISPSSSSSSGARRDEK